MAAAEAVIAALERNWQMVDQALAGLDDATLARRPTDQCNSMAWILWHTNRVVDSWVTTRLQSKPQLWIQEGWHQKFGMSDNPEERGTRWTPQQVAAWEAPPQAVLLGYYEAVKDVARQYLSALTSADLEQRRLVPPATQPRTVADMLGQLTWDTIAHGGQIAYLRGLYSGMGWYR